MRKFIVSIDDSDTVGSSLVALITGGHIYPYKARTTFSAMTVEEVDSVEGKKVEGWKEPLWKDEKLPIIARVKDRFKNGARITLALHTQFGISEEVFELALNTLVKYGTWRVETVQYCGDHHTALDDIGECIECEVENDDPYPASTHSERVYTNK